MSMAQISVSAGLFAASIAFVAVYVAWRERRMRESVRQMIDAACSAVTASAPIPDMERPERTAARVQTANPVETDRSLADAKLLAQVRLMLAARS